MSIPSAMLTLPGDIMHYQINNGTDLRSLNPSTDISAGNYTMNLASTYSACAGFRTGMSSVSCVAPVEWLDFAGTSQDNGVQLQWSTLTETNNAQFEVQRSNNGQEYTPIGYLEGVGNSTEIQQYNYLDRSARQGVNLYRLKQIDIDGTFAYSDQISVNHISPVRIEGYPNPAGDQFTLHIYGWEGLGQLIFRDVQGKEILRQHIHTSGPVPIDTKTWIPGVYFYYLSHERYYIQGKMIKNPHS